MSVQVIMGSTSAAESMPTPGTMDEWVATLQSPNSSDDDKELALRSLMDHFSPDLNGQSIAITKNPELAQEAHQETRISIWQDIEDYRPVGAFGSWVMRIGYNRCIDTLRKEARRQRRIVLYDPTEENDWLSPYTEQQDPAAVYEHRETLADVMSSISRLSPRAQQVIKLYLKGHTNREIAEELDISYDMVKVNLCRSRKALRSALAKNSQ